MNERLRILKLLEEGRISAEEASRLLEALGGGESRKRHHPHGLSFWHSLESIPEMVTSAMAGAFADLSSLDPVGYPRKPRLELRLVSGDIEIQGRPDADLITVRKDGIGKVKEHGDTLEIKTISGNMSITLPAKTDLLIKGVSGDISLSTIDGRIEMTSVSGDITGKNLAGSLVADIVSGDADFAFDRVDRIEIFEKTGDVTLRLPENTAAEIEVSTGAGEGDVECEFDLRERLQKDNLLKGIINKPGGKIVIKNDYGDVAILKDRS